MLSKKTNPETGKHTLCKPAQSKCRWTQILSEPAQATHMDISQEPLCMEFYRDKDTTSIEHWALTLTARTFSVRPHCLGKK